MKMSKFDQYIFMALFIPPLTLCLLGEYHDAMVMTIAPVIVFVGWVNADKIRSNTKLMAFLEKVF